MYSLNKELHYICHIEISIQQPIDIRHCVEVHDSVTLAESKLNCK